MPTDESSLGDSSVAALVIVHAAELGSSLETWLREHPLAWNFELELETDSRSAAEAIRAARTRYQLEPLGFVAPTDIERLDAITAGADEAITMPAPDESRWGDFLDHLVLRARLRREGMAMTRAAAQADKLAALATLVAGVGHEINNPLSAIMLSVTASYRYIAPLHAAAHELMVAADAQRELPAPDVQRLARALTPVYRRDDGPAMTRVLDDIMEAAGAIASVVRDLRVFARADGEERVSVCAVPDVIDHALRLVGREFASRAIVERDYGEQLPQVVLPRHRLTQVLTNLLVNAAHAVQEIDRPSHRVRISARADGEMVAVTVSDTGRGIPPEQLERIFDPFFTTKREGLGTGLGLSISRSILQRLGGDLLVESVHGEGATFICLLPRASEDEVNRASHISGHRVELPFERATQASLLVVDDDERLLRGYARLLGKEYRLVTARDGREAMELIESGTRVDVVVAELDLPEVSGPELYDWLCARDAELASRCAFVTGAQDRPSFATFVREHGERVIAKPVAPGSLRARLEAMVRPVVAVRAVEAVVRESYTSPTGEPIGR